jgi:hypothetical protein
MKKLVYSVAVATAVLFAGNSCQKSQDTDKATPKTDASSRVVFSSVAEYENLFADPNQTDALASGIAARYGTYQENARASENPEDTLYSEFLQKILNEDHIVQIGEWIIKVNKVNEKVFVLDKQYEAEYQDLVNENLSNLHLMIFSTSDEVLPMLQEGYTGSVPNDEARVSGLGICGSDATQQAADIYSNLFNTANSPSNTTFLFCGSKYLRLQIAYQKEGINFTLGHSINTYQASFVTPGICNIQGNLNVEFVGVGADVKHTRKCESSENRWGEVTGSYNSNSATKYYHRGTRALRKYYYSARAVITDAGQTRNLITMAISSGY